MRDLELADEEVDVSRLASVDEVGEAAGHEAAALAPARPEREAAFFADESPAMEQAASVDDLGLAGGPAPPEKAEAVDWDLVDPPSPEGYSRSAI